MPKKTVRKQRAGDSIMLNKLCWCFWQLFPCTYRTFYGDKFGRIHFVVWKMWFGRCYRANDVTVDTFAMAIDETLCLLDALCVTSSEGYEG
jgi:hypothetical protein